MIKVEHNDNIYNFRGNDILIQSRPSKRESERVQSQAYPYLFFTYNELYGIVYHKKTDKLYRVTNPMASKKPIKEVTHVFDHMLAFTDSYEIYRCWSARVYGEDIAKVKPIIMEQYILNLFEDKFIKEEIKKKYGLIKEIQNGYALRYPIKIYDYCIDNKCSLSDAVRYVSENPEKFRDNEKFSFRSEIIVAPGKIKFEKTNKNGKGVDFIKVFIPILSKYTEPDNKKIIEIYKKEREDILKDVIKKIKESKRFVKLGVPMNIFRLTNVTLTSQRELYFLFELKEELLNQ